ncbi:MAG: hypothetical protein ACRELE_00845 [Gemmatimonadales bacterium]
MIASRARAMTVLTLAFALGLIVGGASLSLVARSGKATWLWRNGRAAGRGGYGGSLDLRLHLNLDVAKRDTITAIACRGMAAMDSLRQQLRPPMDSLFQQIRPAIETRRVQTRSEIRALLSAPEQVRYDSLNRADDDQRKKMRDQGPPPSGGPCAGSLGGQGPRGGFNRGPH